MSITLRIILSAVLFAITIISGIWLSNAGKPYNAAAFNVHKLIALASVVFAVLAFIALFRTSAPGPVIITLAVIAGIAVLALFITGAVFSIRQGATKPLLILHAAAPAIALLCAGIAMYLSGK
jgi:hypothetical protein